ncbi:MAG TPA: hypothetical protein DEP87_04550 [Candidatus Pacebacteria bacterium]|nr:hypothetical protein [Candidatus Paceibacterota bacterium]
MQLPNQAKWYLYLTLWQRELVDTSDQLREIFEARFHQGEILPDYGFLVFPLAKAYEGFLKKFFLDLGLIDLESYNSRKFRIGRAFNPDVRHGQRDLLWIYDDVSRACEPEIARQLWQAWLDGRNQVFHYFPDEKGKLNFDQASAKIKTLKAAMDRATTCSRFSTHQS